MKHPVLKVFAEHPELMTEHVRAYVDMFSADLGTVWKSAARRMMLNLLAAMGLLLALIFAGVAVMLGVVLPLATSDVRFLWMVPACPLLLTGLCLVMRSPVELKGLKQTRQDLIADIERISKGAA